MRYAILGGSDSLRAWGARVCGGAAHWLLWGCLISLLSTRHMRVCACHLLRGQVPGPDARQSLEMAASSALAPEL
jgi:hypothetical protein